MFHITNRIGRWHCIYFNVYQGKNLYGYLITEHCVINIFKTFKHRFRYLKYMTTENIWHSSEQRRSHTREFVFLYDVLHYCYYYCLVCAEEAIKSYYGHFKLMPNKIELCFAGAWNFLSSYYECQLCDII